MKNYILILIAAGLFVACEQKETTVTNPPAENKTTIINASPAAKTEKTETNTTVTAPSSETKTETETKTTSSPNP